MWTYAEYRRMTCIRFSTIHDYWFLSGTPTYLMELLKKNDYDLMDLQGAKVSASDLLNVDSMYTNPIPVLYQSGYLTIKGYALDFELYTLDYPNKEVEKGFINYLIPHYTPLKENKSRVFIADLTMGDTLH